MNNIILLLQDTIRSIPDAINKGELIIESPDLLTLLQKIAITLLLGLLIGLEREHSRSSKWKSFAGIRTFPIMALFGFLAALISELTFFWVYVSLFIGYTSLITASYIFSAKEGKIGGTTEVASLVVFVLGSMVFWDQIILASGIAVIITFLLSMKLQLHTLVGKIQEEDIYATLKLALITVIILPLLPDETYGPYDVLNPRLIWYMVIFIAGISFLGFVLIKFIGPEKGIPVTGLMGGMVSSTAVALSFSKRSRDLTYFSVNFATAIILASTLMYPRVFIEVLVVNPVLLNKLWLPLLIFTIIGTSLSYILWQNVTRRSRTETIEVKNPFEIKSALIFGLLFGVILFVSKAGQIYLGDGGTYVISFFAGITSVDAITLSIANLSINQITHDVASSSIIIALIANTIFKLVITLIFGFKDLKKYTLIGLGTLTVASIIYFIISF